MEVFADQRIEWRMLHLRVGIAIARNAALIEAGLDYVAKSNTTLSLSYGGQFGSGVADHAIKASLNVRF